MYAMGLVEDINRELGLSAYEADLRKITGVWKSLQVKQSELRKNPKTEKQYRAFVSKCIKQLRDNDPEMVGDDALKAATDFMFWLQTRKKELGISQLETLRVPSSIEAWAEKNLRPQYDALQMAWSAAIARTSPRTIARLKQAYEDLFQYYTTFYGQDAS